MDQQTQESARVEYRLTGLTCADCAARFERMVQNTDGVVDAKVNFGASKITIYGKRLSPEEINRLGAFDNIQVVRQDKEMDQPPFWQTNTVRLTALSGIFLLAAYGFDLAQAGNMVTILLYSLAIVTGGWETGLRGIGNLFKLRFDMSTLMTVAVGGAIAIGYWEEAAVVAFLFGVSETLESYSIDKARQSLRSLLELAPRQALITRDGIERLMPIEEIQPGDRMRVRPGERIAMDGVIEEGVSFVNQAAVTGESIPVAKGPGDEIFAGSINADGSLVVRVTKRAEDTTLAKIIHLVEEAQEQKAPSQAFVDRFAKYYTPAVMVIALSVAVVPPLFLGGDWRSWIYEGLALLIVACPCALVVSTPVAIVTSIGNAARKGVLIKGGVHLEELGSIRVIAFDKTGTLTEGRPQVQNLDWVSPEDVQKLSILLAIEQASEHPLAASITAMLGKQGIQPVPISQFQAVPGKGAKAVYQGVTYYAGNLRMFEELSADLGEVLSSVHRRQSEGKTVVLFGDAKQVFLLVSLADELRLESREVIARLRREGIEHTVILSGDHKRTVEAIAELAGVSDFQAGLLPEEKVTAVRELERMHGKVAMVGDGVNDAPALAAATTGIAMGGAGTDAAMETANVVLMSDDLGKLPFVLNLSRRTLGVIKQNIAISLLLKLAAVVLVFPGWLTLWLAIMADMGATLIVVLNSLRLVRVGH